MSSFLKILNFKFIPHTTNHFYHLYVGGVINEKITISTTCELNRTCGSLIMSDVKHMDGLKLPFGVDIEIL